MNEIEMCMYELFNGNVNLAIMREWQKAGATLTDIVKAYGIMMKHCKNPSFNYMSKVIINQLDTIRG